MNRARRSRTAAWTLFMNASPLFAQGGAQFRELADAAFAANRPSEQTAEALRSALLCQQGTRAAAISRSGGAL